MLLELFTLRSPYTGMDIVQVAGRVRNGSLSPFLWLKGSGVTVPPWALRVIETCSAYDPDQRPTFEDVFNLLDTFSDSVVKSASKEHLTRILDQDLGF